MNDIHALRTPASVAAARAFVNLHNAAQYVAAPRVAKKLTAAAKRWSRVAFMEARRK